jgi:hypothetical protein
MDECTVCEGILFCILFLWLIGVWFGFKSKPQE